jgi:predicted aconitase with swiveling domain
MIVFKGRPIIPGNYKGECLVSHHGMNMLATFKKSILTKSKKAICMDQDNPDLYKKEISDKIICLPMTIGSTTGGIVIQTAADLGIMPPVLLFSEHIDPLASAGVLVTDIWSDKKIITIDKLGKDFLDVVKTGMILEVKEDGTVMVLDA